MSKAAIVAVLAVLLAPGTAPAQSGDGVPAYVPPPKAKPARSGDEDAYAPKRQPAADAFKAREDLEGLFTGAYSRAGRPRLAVFWNRELSDTLSEWYSEVRVTSTETRTSETTGDIALGQSSTNQQSTEMQRRVRDQRRVQPNETWEWEFQDGFLEPFLKSGATMIDRAAIVRITGADMEGKGERLVETRALQGMADLLIEVLVAPGSQSRTGYELRARVLDVNSGRILAYVNSRGLKEWNAEGRQYMAGAEGITILDDEDEESFGPATKTKYTVDKHGDISRKRKPPKLQLISQNLAYNVMNGLVRQWK